MAVTACLPCLGSKRWQVLSPQGLVESQPCAVRASEERIRTRWHVLRVYVVDLFCMLRHSQTEGYGHVAFVDVLKVEGIIVAKQNQVVNVLEGMRRSR